MLRAVVVIMVVVCGGVMAESSTIMEGVIIRFVFHNSVGRKIKHLHDRSLNSVNCTLVIAIPGPYTHDILPRPDAQHTSADLVIKLIPDDSNDEVLPHPVCEPLAQADDPLSSRDVHRVLPYGSLNARMEEEVVSGGRKEGRQCHMCPDRPE